MASNLQQSLQALGVLGSLKIDKLTQEEQFAAQMTQEAKETKRRQDVRDAQIKREDEQIAARRKREDEIMTQERKQRTLDRAEDKDTAIAHREDVQAHQTKMKEGQLSDADKAELNWQYKIKEKNYNSLIEQKKSLSELLFAVDTKPEDRDEIRGMMSQIDDQLSMVGMDEKDREAFVGKRSEVEDFQNEVIDLMEAKPELSFPEAASLVAGMMEGDNFAYSEDIRSQYPIQGSIESGYTGEGLPTAGGGETVGGAISGAFDPIRNIAKYLSPETRLNSLADVLSMPASEFGDSLKKELGLVGKGLSQTSAGQAVERAGGLGGIASAPLRGAFDLLEPSSAMNNAFGGIPSAPLRGAVSLSNSIFPPRVDDSELREATRFVPRIPPNPNYGIPLGLDMELQLATMSPEERELYEATLAPTR